MKFIVIFLLILVLSCNNDKNTSPIENIECNNLMSQEEMILGNWKWEQTISSWLSDTLTPMSENYNIEIIYEIDSLSYYKNNQLVFKTDFYWQKKYDIYTKDSINILKFTRPKNVDDRIHFADFYMVNCDSLIFDSSPYDGEKILYLRK